MIEQPGLPIAPPDAEDGRVHRIDQTVAIMDHCRAAKVLADRRGDKFLSYILAMAIEEARTNLQGR